jgi:HK97 family phage prohead protease
VLFAQDSSSPPVGRARRVWTDGSRLLADVEFAPPETYAFADTIYRLVKGGFLKSGSVGFLPVDYKFSERPTGGIDYKRQELLEFSIVPVPANSNALIEAQAKRILSRRDIRRLRRAADDSPMPPAVIGNCGRPVQEECGLRTPRECAVHAAAVGGWDGGDGGTGDWDGRQGDLRIWRARKARLDAPVTMQADPARPEDLSTLAARLRHVRDLWRRYGLVKRVDPRIVAADVSRGGDPCLVSSFPSTSTRTPYRPMSARRSGTARTPAS